MMGRRGEREWIGIIFDGGEEGMGIEEKRVAHGTEWFSTPIKERNEGRDDVDAHCSIWLGAMSRGKKKSCIFFFFVYLVNKFFCTIIKSDFIKENGGL
jgi:hypothetical protein